ncbi:MAG: hypothetical protein MI923_19275 [Phycisphaerales bacterium]|nr:hypothetical protein [Phycisphaerales bacterium]
MFIAAVIPVALINSVPIDSNRVAIKQEKDVGHIIRSAEHLISGSIGIPALGVKGFDRRHKSSKFDGRSGIVDSIQSIIAAPERGDRDRFVTALNIGEARIRASIEPIHGAWPCIV